MTPKSEVFQFIVKIWTLWVSLVEMHLEVTPTSWVLLLKKLEKDKFIRKYRTKNEMKVDSFKITSFPPFVRSLLHKVSPNVTKLQTKAYITFPSTRTPHAPRLPLCSVVGISKVEAFVMFHLHKPANYTRTVVLKSDVINDAIYVGKTYQKHIKKHVGIHKTKWYSWSVRTCGCQSKSRL